MTVRSSSGDRIGAEPQAAELIEREQRDVRIAIARRAANAAAHAVGVAARAQAAQRLEPHHRRIVGEARGQHAVRRSLGVGACGARPRRRARIARRRTCASGSCAARREQLASSTAAASISASSARRRTRAPVDRLAVDPARRAAAASTRERCRRPAARSFALRSRTSASSPSRRRADRSPSRRAPPCRAASVPRFAHCAAVAYGRRPSVSHDRRADVRIGFDFQPRGQRGDDGIDRPVRGRGRRRPGLLPSLRRLADGVRRFGADFGQRVAQRPARCRRSARAARAGPARGPQCARSARRRSRAPDRMMARSRGGRRAAILGLQDREPRGGSAAGVCALRGDER